MNDDLIEAFNKLGSCCGWSAEELSTALVKFSQSLKWTANKRPNRQTESKNRFRNFRAKWWRRGKS